MDLKALSSQITTAASTAYCGKVFSENGLFILLETKEWEGRTAIECAAALLDLLLTAFTNYATHDLSTIAQLLLQVENKKEITTLVLGFQKNDQLYLGAQGDGEVMLIRNEKMGTILQKNGVSHGVIQNGDTIVFHTPVFLDMYGTSDIPNLLSPFSEHPLSERVQSDMSAHPEIQGLSLLIAHFTGAKPEMRGFAITPKMILDSIQSVFEKTRTAFISLIKKAPEEDGPLYISTEKERKSKRILIGISAVLVILLIGSVFLNLNRTRDVKKQKQLADSLVLVAHQYDEAGSLIDLNPIRARSLLSESKTTLSSLLSQFSNKSPEYAQIEEWLGKIALKETEAYKIYKLTAVPVFFDITFLKSNGIAGKLIGYDALKAILDSQNGVVYSLNTATKESAIIAGSEIVKNARDLAIHGKDVFLFNDDGVIQVDSKTKTSKIVIKKDSDWGEIVSIASYGGNIYLLDRGKNAIWKYIAVDNGFSDKTTFLNPGVRVNFSDAQNLMIDGSVWVLFSDSLSKYSHGINDQFIISGFSDTLTGLGSFSSDENNKFIYILDKALSRIVVFDKDGVYQSQYQWDDLKNASDIIANEADKKIFVSVGSKIYAIDIK